jgi:hypothetical protein
MELNEEPQITHLGSEVEQKSDVRIEQRGRYWAVFDGQVLVCLTVYKRGAREVVRRLNQQT